MDNYKLSTDQDEAVGGGSISQGVPLFFSWLTHFGALGPRPHLMRCVKNPERRRHTHHPRACPCFDLLWRLHFTTGRAHRFPQVAPLPSFLTNQSAYLISVRKNQIRPSLAEYMNTMNSTDAYSHNVKCILIKLSNRHVQFIFICGILWEWRK